VRVRKLPRINGGSTVNALKVNKCLDALLCGSDGDRTLPFSRRSYCAGARKWTLPFSAAVLYKLFSGEVDDRGFELVVLGTGHTVECNKPHVSRLRDGDAMSV
jgi:hypothetical protein